MGAGRHRAEPEPKTGKLPNTKLLTVILSMVGAAALALGAVVAFAHPFDALEPLQVTVEAQSTPSEEALATEIAQSEEEEILPDPQQFVIAATGDVLIHMAVASDAWNGERYAFSTQFADVTRYLEAADVSICNMEVPVAEPGAQPQGFPVFAAPYDLVEELAIAGFTGCTTASNHAMDQGITGLNRTLDAFDLQSMGHAGTARTPEEASRAQMYQVEKNGVTLTIANIAATGHTNGIPVPEDSEWAVSRIDTDRMIQEAQAARAAGADLVVASLHCCNIEYTTIPEDIQVEVAETLAASGQIDILLSHHAHVPKPLALFEGGPDGNGMWVAYGLGNLISNQGTHVGMDPHSESGLLGFFFVEYDGVEPPVVTAGSWAVVTVDQYNGHNLIVANDEGIVYAQESERNTLSTEQLEQRRALIAAVMEGGAGTEQTGVPENEPGKVTVISRS